jgi:ABC-type transporter Mla subunit MlaD
MSGSIGGAGGHHINSAEIMAWVAQHSGEMGAQVNDSMMQANARVDQLKSLSELKATMSGAHDLVGYNKAAAEIDNFLEANADSPEIEHFKKQLEPIRDAFKQAMQDVMDGSGTMKTIDEAVGLHRAEWIATVDSTSETIKKEDQMGMLSLQESTSQLNQAFQQASNVMQSMHSASMAVLGNIRA